MRVFLRIDHPGAAPNLNYTMLNAIYERALKRDDRFFPNDSTYEYLEIARGRQLDSVAGVLQGDVDAVKWIAKQVSDTINRPYSPCPSTTRSPCVEELMVGYQIPANCDKQSCPSQLRAL